MSEKTTVPVMFPDGTIQDWPARFEIHELDGIRPAYEGIPQQIPRTLARLVPISRTGWEFMEIVGYPSWHAVRLGA